MKCGKRVLIGGMALVMAAGMVGCTQKDDGTQEAGTQAEQTVQTGKEAAAPVHTGNGETKKEETVYVKAEADGTVRDIVVSDILRNGTGAESITDRSELSGIKNVKGKEGFQKREDGTLVWQADGKDIYYQGETKKELPVEVKITYYLEGEQIEPSKLAGKSGNVRIRFDYVNHETQTVMVSGEERTISTPFAVMTGLFLDEEKFMNVEMENGRVISDGSRIMAGGVAIPGLADSIALSEVEDLEDPDIPEYLELTAYTTDFELPLTMTAVTSDFAEEIDLDDMDSYEDLKDDMQELKDASEELVDGTHELVDGVVELQDGAQELYDGAVELDDGAKELKDGAVELDNGAFDLRDGALDLKDALKAYNAGLDTLVASMANADGNGNDITVVAGQLSDGVDQVVDTTVRSVLQQINGATGIEFSDAKSFLEFDASNAGPAADTISGAQAKIRQMLVLKEGMASLSEGLTQVYGGVTTQLKPGAQQILDGARELYDGTKELKDGTEELLDGTTELKDGTVELLDGTVELKDGVQELYDGSIELRDGAGEFDRDGIQKLYDMVCGDLQKVIDRARAVVDAGEAYQSFTGLAPGMKGSVKFLIETEAVE